MAYPKPSLRKLDCKIAERVMGWKRVSMTENWKKLSSKTSYTGGRYWLCRPVAIPSLSLGITFFEGGKGYCDYDSVHFMSDQMNWSFTVPKFSTDLKEAGKVLDKMLELGIPWQISSDHDEVLVHFQAVFDTRPFRVSAHHTCKNMAEAICHAALKILDIKAKRDKLNVGHYPKGKMEIHKRADEN
jgi:Phage ABA sandwich domain